MIEASVGTFSQVWGRARFYVDAAREYCQLVGAAWRAWLYGAVAAGAGMGLSVGLGVALPLWSLAAVPLLTLIAVQFHAFVRVRQQRDASSRNTAMQAHLDEIAALRSRASALKGHAPRDQASYARWKDELVALRQQIHDRIARGISRAEAETFHTVGNLPQFAGGGAVDEYTMLLAVIARDLDHLAELIHGYARFGGDR